MVGPHVVIACDDEEERNDRLQVLLDAVGVECFRADLALGDESVTRATNPLTFFGSNVDAERSAARLDHLSQFPALPPLAVHLGREGAQFVSIGIPSDRSRPG